MNEHEIVLRSNLPLIKAILPTQQGRAIYWAVDEIDRLRAELEKAKAMAIEIREVLA